MSDKKFFGFLAAGLAIIFLLVGGYFFLNYQSSPPPDKNGDTAEEKEREGEDQEGEKEKGNIDQRIASQGKIQEFKNQEEVKEFLQENETVSYDSHRSFSGRGTMAPSADVSTGMEQMEQTQMRAPAEADASKTESSQTTPEHSETNIQVEGVDEADIVKNDGEYIYAISDQDLFIIKSWPAQESEIISKIAFDSHPKNMYLNGNRLAVFGRNDQIYKKERFPDLKERGQFTFFKVFDITDKEEPEQVRDLNFEGQYFDSRMIGDYVYFVTSNPRYHYVEDTPPIPRILEDGKSLTQNCQGNKCLDPEIYHFDIPYNQYNFTNISSINIKDAQEKINSEMYLFSGNQEMYVSPNNIYITYTKNVDTRTVTMEIALEVLEPDLPQEERTKIKKIKQTENYILTPEEKWEKIGRLIEGYFEQLPEEEGDKMEEKVEEKMKEWTGLPIKMRHT